VLNCIKILGRNNGYIIGPSHDITSDIPLENFNAFLNAIKKYNKPGVLLEKYDKY